MKIDKDYISSQNVYAGKNYPKYIIIHETDNWSKGAGAQRHAQAQAAGNLSTSVHYYSGSDGVYQVAAHVDGTYSIGTEYGGNHSVTDANNRNTINIEICVNDDGDYHIARVNAVELVKHLMQITGIPADRVIRHYDAKGKYCPRNMLDDPALWDDFKAQIGQPTARPEPVPPATDAELWYRVGTCWKDGICQEQTGAYRNKDFAIADCKMGQKVFDGDGNVLHSGRSIKPQATGYTQAQFVRDVQIVIGAVVDGIAGDETINKTVTVSRTINKRHAIVTHMERRLKVLGYYNGEIEADSKKAPCFGGGMTDAVNRYQVEVLGYKNADGTVTAGKKMWKSMLGIID